MEKTFKDRVLSLYRRTVSKKPVFKIPVMVFCIILLAFDRLIQKIKARTRKYVASIIALTFAFVSCSFSSVIWDDGSTEFVSEPQNYVVTEESLATLATDPIVVVEEVDIENDDLDEEDIVDEHNSNDVSEMDIILGSDILNNVDIESVILSEDNTDEVTETEDGVIAFSRDDWRLVLVNKNHPIADEYEFNLGYISGTMQCDERVLPDLYAMVDAALNDGVNLTICSPYRNDDRQQMLFDKKVNRYVAQGMSYMEAYKLASQAVTIPGSSEHEIGLAFDMLTNGYSALDSGFGETKAGKWLAEHAYEYGFVVRYPEGKEDITGIEYEPWHMRYVGKNAAEVMIEENLTLEEFWEKYL